MKRSARVSVVVLSALLTCLAVPGQDKIKIDPSVKDHALVKLRPDYVPVVDVLNNGGGQPIPSGSFIVADYTTVTLKVANKGDFEFKETSTVTYSITVSGNVVKSETNKQIGGIQKGVSWTVLGAFKVPVLQSGQQKVVISFSVDTSNKVQESNETNNSVTFQYTAQYPPR